MFEKFLPAAVAWLAAVSVGVQAADPVPAAEQKQPARIVASPTTAVVQPTIPVGAPVPLDVGKFVFLDVQGHAGPITWEFSTVGIVALLPDGATPADYYPGIKQGELTPQWHKSPSKTAAPCLGAKQGNVTISAWGVADGRAKKIAELTIQVGPRPPPDVKPDPKPDPKPDDPKPPVTSFRVILGYESAATMTQPQVNVLYGSVVESWLNENCTGGKAGWRRRDKDAAGDADPTMAALWKAVQEKITAVPFAAVERNGQVEIIPLEATPDAMIAKLTKYREGK